MEIIPLIQKKSRNFVNFHTLLKERLILSTKCSFASSTHYLDKVDILCHLKIVPSQNCTNSELYHLRVAPSQNASPGTRLWGASLNCHFPSLSQTIEADGDHEPLWGKRKKSWNRGNVKWRKITIFLHFAATIEVVVIWSHSHPKKEPIFPLLCFLLCYAYTSMYYFHSAISWLEYTAL